MTAHTSRTTYRLNIGSQRTHHIGYMNRGETVNTDSLIKCARGNHYLNETTICVIAHQFRCLFCFLFICVTQGERLSLVGKGTGFIQHHTFPRSRWKWHARMIKRIAYFFECHNERCDARFFAKIYVLFPGCHHHISEKFHEFVGKHYFIGFFCSFYEQTSWRFHL
ncbi:hypothetical protein AR158_c456L [Paramecium bursaria Chlorella virus AR158]|uniref:hypothetical protein n=1 Tax=Paramecium bursaria Chlorella virus AR158 TaxID=380598 RepID=UPI00015AA6EA|nr:hypothetical protein AR158_c456L [Paramecium bursaria Chlorella virus AR158]ABU44001.1 hypothetical protein AR158_c456L [Paramecium bursaria Chlorella virus AR158]